MGTASNAIQIDDGPFTAPGFSLGHWTHPERTTGCTVLVADHLSPGAVEVRGGSPGTRETDLLGSGRSVQAADAILLTGGSVFGLAAADGVVQWLAERGRGYPTGVVNVPIVPGAVIFDLVGEDPDWPDADAGYAAADSATETWSSGRVGGGAGASNSKLLGREFSVPTGLGVAQVSTSAGTVSAVIINNAFGDVLHDREGHLLTTPGGRGVPTEALVLGASSPTPESPNTVLGAVVVDRPIHHDALTRLAMAGQTGLARVVRPAHSPADGDTVFALAQEQGDCSLSDLMQLVTATQVACARATVNSAVLDETPSDQGDAG